MDGNQVVKIQALTTGVLTKLQRATKQRQKVTMGGGQVASVRFRTKFWTTNAKMDTLDPEVAFSSQGRDAGRTEQGWWGDS
jgi:hypothetical protein